MQSEATCCGDKTLSTKVDRETVREFEIVAAENDISRSELLRRLIDLYRDSRRGEFRCPSCSKRLRLEP